MKKWSVTIKGSHDKNAHEICVEYGKPLDSWGWFCKEKIRISGYAHGETDKFVWDKLITLANEVSDHLNNNHPNGFY